MNECSRYEDRQYGAFEYWYLTKALHTWLAKWSSYHRVRQIENASGKMLNILFMLLYMWSRWLFKEVGPSCEKIQWAWVGVWEHVSCMCPCAEECPHDCEPSWLETRTFFWFVWLWCQLIRPSTTENLELIFSSVVSQWSISLIIWYMREVFPVIKWHSCGQTEIDKFWT